jgi:hypothetical protein
VPLAPRPLSPQAADPDLLDLVACCLQLDPASRPSAAALLRHRYFADLPARVAADLPARVAADLPARVAAAPSRSRLPRAALLLPMLPGAAQRALAASGASEAAQEAAGADVSGASSLLGSTASAQLLATDVSRDGSEAAMQPLAAPVNLAAPPKAEAVKAGQAVRVAAHAGGQALGDAGQLMWALPLAVQPGEPGAVQPGERAMGALEPPSQAALVLELAAPPEAARVPVIRAPSPPAPQRPALDSCSGALSPACAASGARAATLPHARAVESCRQLGGGPAGAGGSGGGRGDSAKRAGGAEWSGPRAATETQVPDVGRAASGSQPLVALRHGASVAAWTDDVNAHGGGRALAPPALPRERPGAPSLIPVALSQLLRSGVLGSARGTPPLCTPSGLGRFSRSMGLSGQLLGGRRSSAGLGAVEPEPVTGEGPAAHAGRASWQRSATATSSTVSQVSLPAAHALSWGSPGRQQGGGERPPSDGASQLRPPSDRVVAHRLPPRRASRLGVPQPHGAQARAYEISVSPWALAPPRGATLPTVSAVQHSGTATAAEAAPPPPPRRRSSLAAALAPVTAAWALIRPGSAAARENTATPDSGGTAGPGAGVEGGRSKRPSWWRRQVLARLQN